MLTVGGVAVDEEDGECAVAAARHVRVFVAVLDATGLDEFEGFALPG